MAHQNLNNIFIYLSQYHYKFVQSALEKDKDYLLMPRLFIYSIPSYDQTVTQLSTQLGLSDINDQLKFAFSWGQSIKEKGEISPEKEKVGAVFISYMASDDSEKSKGSQVVQNLGLSPTANLSKIKVAYKMKSITLPKKGIYANIADDNISIILQLILKGLGIDFKKYGEKTDNQ